MNIYQYVAFNRPIDSATILGNAGIRPSRDKRELSKQLYMFVQNGGEKAWMQIARIHPDLPLFEKLNENALKFEKENMKTKEYSNACGCSNFSNTDGQSMKNEIASKLESNRSEILIVGGVVLLGLALILKK